MTRAKTVHFKNLVQNVNLLKTNLLPNPNPLGAYSPSELLKIRAFRVLAHAELENYIENVCRDVLSATQNSTNTSSKNKVEQSLIKYNSVANEKKHFGSAQLKTALGSYRDSINKNHGIKEKNIFTLFIPIGIDIEQIDSTLLAALESYGETRGRIAHNNISHNVAGLALLQDPTVELNEIQNIITALKPVDLSVRRLLR